MALFPLRKLTIPLLGLTLALGGCAGTAGQYDKVVEIAPENSLLRFYGKAQTGIQPLRVAFADPWEYEEYAGFNGQEMRLEVFYVTKASVQTAVQYPYALRNMVETWNHNTRKSIAWGESGDVYNPIPASDISATRSLGTPLALVSKPNGTIRRTTPTIGQGK